MKNLPVFSRSAIWNQKQAEKMLYLVPHIIHFVLGPTGTNMEQACKDWMEDIAGAQCDGGFDQSMFEKQEIVLCGTPEEALEKAKAVREEGVVPLFWTCAVYFRLNELFFENPDVYTFLLSHSHELDNMQLCVRAELSEQEWVSDWRIASHPSPQPLVTRLDNPVVQTTSNAQAAILCAQGEVEACITTAQAAKIHELHIVHEFGSPTMVFFAGTTEHGINVLLKQ